MSETKADEEERVLISSSFWRRATFSCHFQPVVLEEPTLERGLEERKGSGLERLYIQPLAGSVELRHTQTQRSNMCDDISVLSVSTATNDEAPYGTH